MLNLDNMSNLEYPYLRGKKRNETNRQYEYDIKKNLGNVDYLLENYKWRNSGVDHYSLTFARELKKYGDIFGYLSYRFVGRKINCLDIGGSGNRLFEDIYNLTIEQQYYKAKDKFVDLNKTMGISLHHGLGSYDSDDWKHECLTGDAFSDKTFEKTEEYFGLEGVDFIISRMGRGLDFTPENPFQIFKALKNYYSLLNIGGSMLLQLPVRHERLIASWVNFLRRNIKPKNLKIITNFPDSDEMEPYDATTDNSTILTILIEKNIGAPLELPGLSKFAVFKMKRD